ncbi:hypothetical protein GCM10018793_27090 [Streptomyces sulfonofaciens]|uniref:Uncharacterized protein n=1 Tax=Streptomyces sulfonofaciens TaxID=68272 RepID=A0A919G5W9_9ACTN|nr:hypothetical protein [Streptomyces sulfonofaciens]GHH77895.1 hypothetical protein GCM10018793_27090 [Streptomyces sulfonofaciens]
MIDHSRTGKGKAGAPREVFPGRTRLPLVLQGMNRDYVGRLPGGGLLISSPGAGSLLQDMAEEEAAPLRDGLAGIVRAAGDVLDNPTATRTEIRDVACHLLDVLMDVAVEP